MTIFSHDIMTELHNAAHSNNPVIAFFAHTIGWIGLLTVWTFTTFEEINIYVRLAGSIGCLILVLVGIRKGYLDNKKRSLEIKLLEKQINDNKKCTPIHQRSKTSPLSGRAVDLLVSSK